MADPGFLRWGCYYFGKFFSENCMKLKEIGPGGGAHPNANLDPPMVTIRTFINLNGDGHGDGTCKQILKILFTTNVMFYSAIQSVHEEKCCLPLHGSLFSRNSASVTQPPPTRTITVLLRNRTKHIFCFSPICTTAQNLNLDQIPRSKSALWQWENYSLNFHCLFHVTKLWFSMTCGSK